jgi:hypothetical protein
LVTPVAAPWQSVAVTAAWQVIGAQPET